MSAKTPKSLFKILFVLSLTLLSALLIFPVFYTYTVPMNDKVFDFSLLAEDGKEWEGMNGWTVYKMEGTTPVSLESDGSGGFYGLSFSGETFYYSRELTQKLPDPILEIGVANRNVAIFLDDKLLYTDCPTLDNTIGSLQLPMAEYERIEPLLISLPTNYTGKTLTIAQSSPPANYSEKQQESSTVWPCAVSLYCGYAYESQVVGETTTLMIWAAFLGILGFFLLFASICQAWLEGFDWTILLLPVFLFLNMFRVLFSGSFSSYYFPILDSTKPFYINLPETFGMLSFAVLYGFLAVRAQKEKYLLLFFALLQCLGTIYMTATHGGATPFIIEAGSFLMPVFVFLLGIKKWREKNPFFTTFTHSFFFTASILTMVILTTIFLSREQREHFREMVQSISFYNLHLPILIVQILLLPPTIFAVTAEFLRKMTARSNERLSMKLKEEAAQKHYDVIRRQIQESAMLRHDMNRHFQMLQTLLKDNKMKRAEDYIQEILKKSQENTFAVHTGNYMIDNILNSRIAVAEEKKIPFHITFSDILPQLPILDNDICSLLLNALDNAIEAAQETKEPNILVSLHQENNFLCFEVKNTYFAQTKKETTPEHGFGLPIMKRIIEKYQGVYQFEKNTTTACLRLMLPIA